MIKSTEHSNARRIIALALAAVCLSLPLIGGCTGASSNLLIGSWKFSRATGTMAKGCNATNVFTDKTWTFTFQGGGTASAGVTYNVNPKEIFVINSGTGGFGTYKIIDENHVYTESAWGNCIYERTK